MARQKGFAYAVGEAPCLEIAWDYGHTDAKVEFEGRPLGIVKTKAELERGWTTTLPDGRILSLRLASAWLAPTWAAACGETVLVPSDGNPERDASWARGVLGLNALFGLLQGLLSLGLALGAATSASRSADLREGLPRLALGVLCGAAFVLARKHDRRGYTIGIGTCLAVLATNLFFVARDGGASHAARPLIALAVVLVLLVRGLRGHDALFPPRRAS